MGSVFNTDDKYAKVYHWLFVVVVIAGSILRIHMHFSGRAIWEDEAHLSLNFIYFGYKDLLNPLEHYQVAPILFLYGVETFTRVFGYSEVALRSFPFILSLVTFPLFYYVAYYISNSRLCAIISFTILSFCFTVLHYSSEVKPYTLELSAYIVLVYIVLSQHDIVKKYRYTLLAIAGSLAMLLANASHIVLACVALYIVSEWIYSKKASKEIIAIELNIPKRSVYAFVVLAIVFLVNYFTFISGHPYSDGMKQIWAARFLPTWPFGSEFASFMQMIIGETFFDSMLMFTRNAYFPYVVTLLYIIALVYSVVRLDKRVFIFVLLPVLLHMVLSMAKIYPIYFRFYLYLLPALVIMLSIGITYVVKLLQKKLPFAVAVIPALLVVAGAITPSLLNINEEGRNIKPGLAYINNKPHDMKLFVTTPSTLYEYYYRVGRAMNSNSENIPWFLSPEEYYNTVSKHDAEYLLLCSTDGYADGYKGVIDDLKAKGLVIDEFTYGSYTILQVQPKP